MTDEHDSDGYDVGYCKPPKHTQFKKGQSGNPKGRPKGTRNFKTDLIETLRAPVQIKDKQGHRTVSTQAATLWRLREKALAGDQKALDRYLDLASIYNNDDSQIAAQAPLSAEDKSIIDKFLERRQKRDGSKPIVVQTATKSDNPDEEVIDDEHKSATGALDEDDLRDGAPAGADDAEKEYDDDDS